MAVLVQDEQSAHVERCVSALLAPAANKPLLARTYSLQLAHVIGSVRAKGWTLEEARKVLSQHRDVAWVVEGFRMAGIEKRKR